MQFGNIQQIVGIILQEAFQLSAEVDRFSCFEQAMVRINPKAEKGNAGRRWKYLRTFFMQGEPQFGEFLDDLPSPISHFLLVV